MSATASPPETRARPRPHLDRRLAFDLVWAGFALACVVTMVLWPSWQSLPFYLLWISLALVYGWRVWDMRTTVLVLLLVAATSAAGVMTAVLTQHQDWKLLLKVPLMAMLFMAMVWHARARAQALRATERQAMDLHDALERQERFIHDASHELKTPVTIARGHLELLRSDGRHDVEIALDELRRIDSILGKLLLLATVGQPDFLQPRPTELEPFLEDVFMRWSEVAPRSWRLGPIVDGPVLADPDRLRTALDALLDNAVKYSEAQSAIELRARWGGDGAHVVIEVEDEGIGISREAIGRIFARFGRADVARTRSAGGVGLGLAIVEAIAAHHGGHCSVQSGPRGSVFSLHLPVADGLAPEAWEPLDASVAS